MAWIALAVSTATLYWIYDGYGRFLSLSLFIRNIFRKPASSVATEAEPQWPEITVLLTVHNEEDVVESRIANLLSCDYPNDRLRIVVASDGSTDSTNGLVRSVDDSRVALFESPGLGKTGTQNEALKKINSDVVLFTDADIVFDTDFLTRIAERFRDSQVGAVDGRLLYSSTGRGATESSDTTASQGFYWNYELKVRHLESQLGWLAVVAGACFAVRRELLQPMESSIGEDCIVPLDVVKQGARVVHEPLARAFDKFEEGSGITLRRRIRQTLRNWQGTWSRPSLLNPFRHPFYALALWSHKLLRWLSPVFLLIAVFASAWLVITGPNLFSVAAALPYMSLFVMAAIECVPGDLSRRVPGTGMAFSFILANTAFFIGVLRATLGRRVHSYRNA